MKTAPLFLLIFCSYFLSNAQDASSKPSPFELKAFEVIEKEGKTFIQVALYNKGKVFAYPIVQVQLGDEVIANKAGTFDIYGILQHTSQAFKYPVSLPKQEGKLKFIILISSGIQKDIFKIEHEYER